MTVGTLTTEEVSRSLERADIILTRGRGIVAWLIRWATRSHWNHAALVFVLGDQASGRAQGYRSTFIIEAEARGVDIHPIDKYLNIEKQDMVILRLPDDAVPADFRADYLRRVRGFALEEIDARYGFLAISKIIRRLFGKLALPVEALVFLPKLIFHRPGSAEFVNSWICSGIVQYAYYRSCFAAEPNTGSWQDYFGENSHRAKVVFNPSLRARVENGLSYQDVEAGLKQTTPAQYALAATYGALTVVGQRIDGAWSSTLTRP